jgi:dTDP-4-amino-4,6-dideoxygalactose transaminase
MRNFGHRGQEDFWGLGVNGKNPEFHAAMGLCVLPKSPELILKRRAISELYDGLLDWHRLSKPRLRKQTTYNFAYYPVLFQSEEHLPEVREALHVHQIYPRRYFYPSLNALVYANLCRTPVSEEIAKRVLTLPLSHGLDHESVQLISTSVQKAFRRGEF